MFNTHKRLWCVFMDDYSARTMRFLLALALCFTLLRQGDLTNLGLGWQPVSTCINPGASVPQHWHHGCVRIPMLTEQALNTDPALQLILRHTIFRGCLTPQSESLTVLLPGLLCARPGSNVIRPIPTSDVSSSFCIIKPRAKISIIFYCKHCISPLCRTPFFICYF